MADSRCMGTTQSGARCKREGTEVRPGWVACADDRHHHPPDRFRPDKVRGVIDRLVEMRKVAPTHMLHDIDYCMVDLGRALGAS